MEYFRNTVITTVDLIICGAATLVLLIVAAGGIMMLGGAKEKVTTLEAEAAALRVEISEAKQVAARQNELEAHITQVKSQIVEFEQRLPTQREIPELLESFQEVASQSGVRYERIVAEGQQEQPLYVKLPFTISVRGRYLQLGEFLKNLEFGERFIKVESLHLQQERDNVSKATFAISTYTFVEDTVEEEGV